MVQENVMGRKRKPVWHGNFLATIGKGDGMPIEVQGVRTFDSTNLPTMLDMAHDALAAVFEELKPQFFPDDACTPSRASVYISLEISQRS